MTLQILLYDLVYGYHKYSRCFSGQEGGERTNFCQELNSGIVTGSPVHYALRQLPDKLVFPLPSNVASMGNNRWQYLFLFRDRPIRPQCKDCVPGRGYHNTHDANVANYLCEPCHLIPIFSPFLLYNPYMPIISSRIFLFTCKMRVS